jgi:pyruvate-formate lyase-activating enzyme
LPRETVELLTRQDVRTPSVGRGGDDHKTTSAERLPEAPPREVPPPTPLSAQEEERRKENLPPSSAERGNEGEKKPPPRSRLPEVSIVESGDGWKNSIIWVNTRCQMRCAFCWVDLAGEEKPPDETLAEINLAAEAGCRQLTFSGGEPTLSRELPALVAQARKLGFPTILLETNAVLLANAERTRELVAAGLTDLFVSLHASRAELADEITGLPGGFEQTVAGIREALAQGLGVMLNYVIHPANLEDLPDFPAFVVREIGLGPGLAGVRFSIAQPITPHVDRTTIPRYSDAAGPLKRALEACLELGIRVPEVGGQCGIPACMMEGDRRFFPRERRQSRSQRHDRNFTYPPVCAECLYRELCAGVRTNYLAIHGDAEFHPVRE